MRLAYHSLPAELWAAAPVDRPYAPPSLEQEGFIHTTIGEQALARVLTGLYRADPRPFVALMIDLDRVEAHWDVSHAERFDADVPHIHGPLNRSAILGTIPLPRDGSGAFLPLQPAGPPAGAGERPPPA
jgi:uncharacterized protein (DUF952 family)